MTDFATAPTNRAAHEPGSEPGSEPVVQDIDVDTAEAAAWAEAGHPVVTDGDSPGTVR